MMEKREILILTHGSWGKECIRSAEMIIGEIEELYFYSLEPSDSLDELQKRIEREIKERNSRHPIVISDLKDGSTSHVATYIAYISSGLAISGLSMSVLIAAVREREEKDDNTLCSIILKEGREGISDISIKG